MKTSTSKIPDLFWTGLIAVFTLVVHMVTYNTLGFHRDELLYLALGKHLAAGYWSNPPLIGFISFLSQLLPGRYPVYIEIISGVGRCIADHHNRINDTRAGWQNLCPGTGLYFTRRFNSFHACFFNVPACLF